MQKVKNKQTNKYNIQVHVRLEGFAHKKNECYKCLKKFYVVRVEGRCMRDGGKLSRNKTEFLCMNEM